MFDLCLLYYIIELARIKDDFDLDVWDYLHDFGKIGTQQKDLIYLFMEQRGIKEDGTCWDSIAKIYQRQRNVYLHKKFAEKVARLQRVFCENLKCLF